MSYIDYSDRTVHGFCPVCGGETLFLGEGGDVTCTRPTCPRPTAVAEILGEGECGHLLGIDHFDYSVIHPLVERLDNVLLDCELTRYMRSLAGPPVQPGYYRVTGSGDSWEWELLASDE
jgi:hypothetical protein